VLADAFVKGVRVGDIETLYEGLQSATVAVHPSVSSTGRLGHEYYNRLGYVPCDVGIHENAARTLEYAYNDWCILQVAKALGRPKKEQRELEKRALNYRNLFRSDYNLMCGRKADGSFEENFSPLKWGGNFTEGNSWHYTWSVFHDVQGLIDLMGGKKYFVQMLDSVFTVPPHYDDSYYGFPIHEIREMTVMNMGNYAHGNQPAQHMIYLYNYVGEPWKAQYWLRQVMERMYSPTPDGYCGDEDNGQTSAWYVFSALGFYPVCPASNEYVLGAPLFKRATVHLENGNSFIVDAADNSPENIYIGSMTLDGKDYTRNYVTHGALMGGVRIELRMDSVPCRERGTAAADMPYSFSNEKR
jgi:predicted alpha-1,2-mannosidase